MVQMAEVHQAFPEKLRFTFIRSYVFSKARFDYLGGTEGGKEGRREGRKEGGIQPHTMQDAAACKHNRSELDTVSEYFSFFSGAEHGSTYQEGPYVLSRVFNVLLVAL